MLSNFLLLYLSSRVSLSIRVYIAYSIILVVSYSMPLVAEFLPRSPAWYLLLSLVVVNGAANSFVQGGMFGFASVFPRKYMTSLMVGQGVNGMILNSVKMFLLIILLEILLQLLGRR